MERARLILDYDDDRSSNVVDSLRILGYPVTTTPVSGTQPDLWVGNRNYQGIDEIERFIEKHFEEEFENFVDRWGKIKNVDDGTILNMTTDYVGKKMMEE